jgi:hypothetical protein
MRPSRGGRLWWRAMSSRPARSEPSDLCLERLSGLDAAEVDWESLAERADNIFATREWLSTWWRHFGRGEARLLGCRPGRKPRCHCPPVSLAPGARSGASLPWPRAQRPARPDLRPRRPRGSCAGAAARTFRRVTRRLGPCCWASSCSGSRGGTRCSVRRWRGARAARCCVRKAEASRRCLSRGPELPPAGASARAQSSARAPAALSPRRRP